MLCLEVQLEVRTTNYVIMFLVAVLASVAVLDIRVQELSLMTQKYAEYNHAVDAASDDAMGSLVEMADVADVQINYTACIDSFYESLYASFGAMDNAVLQSDLQLYTPVLAIIGTDGFFVVHNSVNNYGRLVKVWSEKLPFQRQFSYKDSFGREHYYTVVFRLDDRVSVILHDGTTSASSRIYTGKYNELAERYPTSPIADVFRRTILAEDGTFFNWKSQVIVDSVVSQMNFFAKKNNDIANAFGISYNFMLPESASSDLANSIGDVSLVVLFQGFPYGGSTSDTFSKFSVSGAQMSKQTYYYVRYSNIDARCYYHELGCTRDNNNPSYQYVSDVDAALTGALPCPYCCE